MSRAPFNVLVIPFRVRDGIVEVAVFHRAGGEMWQFVAGGGEDDETPAQAARREASEEAAIGDATQWIALESTAVIPRSVFVDAPWPDTVTGVREHAFAVELDASAELVLSAEHDRCEWLEPETAHARLTWASNRVALAELLASFSGA